MPPAPDPVTTGWRSWPVGTRVVVRRVRDDDPAAGEPRLTDVLGELLAVDDDGLVVATRRGPVPVPAADVVAARRVPPAPPRRGAG